MGCAKSQNQSHELGRLNTVNGVLKVTIINAKIEHLTSTFFQMDPYIKIKVSNQRAQTKIIQKGGKQPIFNESHLFFINSCFQTKGRYLQLQLWDKNKTTDSLIGFGIADLDPFLNPKLQKKDIRIFLNHQRKSAGIVNVQLQFKQQPYELINFRFQTASIRRKTSTFSNMNCFVQVTIGEEILKTKKQKDTKQLPPVWTDQLLIFNVPKIIKNCLIQIFDDTQLVGSLVVNVQDFLKQSKQQNFDLQFDHKNIIAGTIKFQTILGTNPQFSQIKRQYKRKSIEEKKPTVQNQNQKKPSTEQKKPQKNQNSKKATL